MVFSLLPLIVNSRPFAIREISRKISHHKKLPHGQEEAISAVLDGHAHSQLAAYFGEESAPECRNCDNRQWTGTARAALIAEVRSQTTQLSPCRL
jgi:hypothetical protein